MNDKQRKAMFAKIHFPSSDLEKRAIKASKSTLKNGDQVITTKSMWKGKVVDRGGFTGKLRFTDTRFGGKGYGDVTVKHEKGGSRTSTFVDKVRLSTPAERKKADDNDAEILRIIKQ